MRKTIIFMAAAVWCAGQPATVTAQEAPSTGDIDRVRTTIDAALAAISREDFVALTDLMIEEAVFFPTVTRDGVDRYSVRTRAAQRAAATDVDFVERGFDPEIRISGPIASVWLPYDLYLDGKWSHCGVDTFILVRVEGTWKIATMAWSAVQPPECTAHPDGAPGSN